MERSPPLFREISSRVSHGVSLLLLLLGLLLRHEHSPPSVGLVAHRFATQVFGKLSPAPLVVEKIDVELRESRNLESAFFEGAVKHARVIRRQEMNRPVIPGRGPEPERPRDRRRIAFDVPVARREAL